jgi:hypothetical protein
MISGGDAGAGRSRTTRGVTGREVGRVAALWRYPVKSMAGEPLEAVEVGWRGLAGDRRWAFVQPDMPRSGFPWLTIRQRPAMSHYRPTFDDPARPDESRVTVETPSGTRHEVIDEALARELGEGVRVLKQHVGVFDTMPLSLMTLQTVASLDALVEPALEPLRFRPNLVVDAHGGEAYPEDAWVGAELRIGELVMRVDQRDQRCVMINVDPVTTSSDPSVLRAVAQQREACLGVYGTIVTPGRVALGDPVTLRP